MSENQTTQEQPQEKVSWVARKMETLKSSKVYKIYKFLISSAAVSFVVSAVVFVYGQIRKEQISADVVGNLHSISSNLVEVQNSVSTRYLGIFPDYLEEVNGLLSHRNQKDTVVIFEDVLYYGILSKPENFIKMNHMLLSHADQGGKVTIAYYNVEPPFNMTFHRMIREQRINTRFFGDVAREVDSLRRDSLRRAERRQFSDAEICEKYFDKTRSLDPGAFTKNVDKYLKPLAGKSKFDDELGRELEQMYVRMDSIKTHYLDKPKKEIRFKDYEEMYIGMSEQLIDVYKAHGIELIPLNDYLMMSCWLVGGQAVLAFPSKYATDEIGFYSQDPAFSKYIKTMLKGVKGHY